MPALQTGRRTIAGPFTLAGAIAVGARGASRTGVAARRRSATRTSSRTRCLRRQGNRDFFLRALAWLIGEQEATIVAVESRENRRIELTEGTRAWMYIVNVGLLPLLPLRPASSCSSGAGGDSARMSPTR